MPPGRSRLRVDPSDACNVSPMPHEFSEGSADDLMRESISRVIEFGETVEPTKGPMRELQSVVLELTNPLARLSRSERRGRLFSALGEVLWYLSRSNDVEFIAYYIDDYRSLAEEGAVWGGYGRRLFSF